MIRMNILSYIMNVRDKHPRRAMLVSGIVLVLLIAVVIAIVMSRRATRAYETYAELAQAQVDAAHVPAAPNNPVRQDLNRALSLALSSQVSSRERLAQAQAGMRLLELADGQVDEIGEASAKVDLLLAQAQVQSASGFAPGGLTWEILALAKKRSAIISDISGLSYRANFVTRGILERIIADRGVLTDEHVTSLNNSLPDLEEQFDRRSNLYTELERVGVQIDQKQAASRWF